ncbi:hypothetical protein IV494_06820 [Kaistella sp. G5-32]|uniref:PRTase-CE domain-containing protein n=1 Tax=Kaistella gelatinilytica TaxID=2787636 RepID=A0ABS0FB39_9FLAO|nr:hypothetical protein [Kaistella gelatinilytica]MBF8456893.1 hypothetical protein [Kaistella gelatinilytica]
MTTVESILVLHKIFKNNNWYERDSDEFIFNNFCKLLDNLDSKQRVLIIELVSNYKWISYGEYPEKILSTLDNIESTKLNILKKIYFFPVIKFEDEGEIKSGTFLMYPIKAFKKDLKNYQNINFTLNTKFETFTNPDFILKENELIFLIDDYIGSGETLEACLGIIRQNPNITNDKIKIIALAIQAEIAENITGQGIEIFCENILLKGISDYNSPPVVDEKIQMMLEIEKLIPGGSHFSLGYNRTEALITLSRTPDNTFPIFWKKYKIGNKKFDAPFSREETVES